MCPDFAPHPSLPRVHAPGARRKTGGPEAARQHIHSSIHSPGHSSIHSSGHSGMHSGHAYHFLARWASRALACSSKLANPAWCRASDTVPAQSQVA